MKRTTLSKLREQLPSLQEGVYSFYIEDSTITHSDIAELRNHFRRNSNNGSVIQTQVRDRELQVIITSPTHLTVSQPREQVHTSNLVLHPYVFVLVSLLVLILVPVFLQRLDREYVTLGILILVAVGLTVVAFKGMIVSAYSTYKRKRKLKKGQARRKELAKKQ